MGLKRTLCCVFMGRPEGKDINHYEDIDEDGTKILKWIVEKWDWMVVTGFI
jgi:hypothetical protein